MIEMAKMFRELASTEAVGWTLICVLVSAITWIIAQWVRTNGELSVAKQNAEVSLSQQGGSLVLRLVEEQKEELDWLRKKVAGFDTDMREHLSRSEKLCDHLIAILRAPDELLREYQMERAREYLIEIGRWPEGDVQ